MSSFILSQMIMNLKQSSFSGVVLTVSRLVGITGIIGSKMFSKSRFNNTFDDFRYERKIKNWTLVRKLVFIKVRFFFCSRGDIVDC